jgi:hypothetical protein
VLRIGDYRRTRKRVQHPDPRIQAPALDACSSALRATRRRPSGSSSAICVWLAPSWAQEHPKVDGLLRNTHSGGPRGQVVGDAEVG